MLARTTHLLVLSPPHEPRHSETPGNVPDLVKRYLINIKENNNNNDRIIHIRRVDVDIIHLGLAIVCVTRWIRVHILMFKETEKEGWQAKRKERDGGYLQIGRVLLNTLVCSLSLELKIHVAGRNVSG